MATVGYTSIGASGLNAGSGSGSNNPQGLLITMPTAGSISKITCYVGMSVATRSTNCQIYTGTAGALGTLQSTTTTSPVTTTPAWVDFTFASPFSASATTYWIEFTGYGGEGPGTPVASINYDTGGATNTGYSKSDVSVPVYNTNQFSIYATYTATGGTGRPTATGRISATGRLTAGTRTSATGRVAIS